MPCSIWMPPCASGPVFTVRRPRRTGLLCASAGMASVAVTAAVPARNARRLSFAAIGGSFALPAPGRLQSRRLVRHAPSDRNMTELIPHAIDLGQYHIVGLVNIDRIRGGHPAGTSRHPEDFGPISFGIEEVAADRAGVIDDVLDAIALGDQAPVEDAEIVETGHPQRDLLDQMRVLRARSSSHERDLVVDLLRICAQ